MLCTYVCWKGKYVSLYTNARIYKYYTIHATCQCFQKLRTKMHPFILETFLLISKAHWFVGFLICSSSKNSEDKRYVWKFLDNFTSLH